MKTPLESHKPRLRQKVETHALFSKKNQRQSWHSAGATGQKVSIPHPLPSTHTREASLVLLTNTHFPQNQRQRGGGRCMGRKKSPEIAYNPLMCSRRCFWGTGHLGPCVLRFPHNKATLDLCNRTVLWFKISGKSISLRFLFCSKLRF